MWDGEICLMEQKQLNEYWINRGKEYKIKFDLLNKTQHKRYEYQIKALKEKLINLNPQTILEIGCGFGRVTETLSQFFPRASITCIDISKEQIDNLNKLSLHNVESICMDIMNYDFEKTFDLIIASEVFMHLSSESMNGLAKKLIGYPRIIIIELTSASTKLAGHCFIHNYNKLFPQKHISRCKLKLPFLLRFRKIALQELIEIA